MVSKSRVKQPVSSVLVAVEMAAIVLGGKRSLIAPPTSIKMPRGIAAVIKTVPRAIPDPVFCKTNQVRATNQN